MTRPQCTCKFGVSPACPAHGKKEDDPADNLDQYRIWFNKNHPFDWWAKERNGKPLPHRDRLLVDRLARAAFEAGQATRATTSEAGGEQP